MTRIAVVLPAPLGPSSTVMRPSGTRMVRFDRAGTRPKFLATSRISTTSPFGAWTSASGVAGPAAGAGPGTVADAARWPVDPDGVPHGPPSGGSGLVPDPG